MKKLIIFTIALGLITFAGCKKRDTDDISTVVDVTHPSIELNGDKFITLPVGGSYTDEGAVATDDISGATSSIMAESSNLDPSTPGMYYMLYTTQNANGYITNVVRYIGVTAYNDAVDMSGTYVRTANGVEVEVSKVAPSMYKNADMGGAGLTDALYFVIINDTTIAAGPQFSESLNAEIQTASERLSLDDPFTFRYALGAPGYGTAVRIFQKVE